MALIRAVTLALAWKHDSAGTVPSWEGLLKYLRIRYLLKLADPAENSEMPTLLRFLLAEYLESLPGFAKGAPWQRQPGGALDVHGYAQMRATKLLGNGLERL